MSWTLDGIFSPPEYPISLPQREGNLWNETLRGALYERDKKVHFVELPGGGAISLDELSLHLLWNELQGAQEIKAHPQQYLL